MACIKSCPDRRFRSSVAPAASKSAASTDSILSKECTNLFENRDWLTDNQMAPPRNWKNSAIADAVLKSVGSATAWATITASC